MAEDMGNWAVFSVKCCNPFKEINHSKSLRKVIPWMCSSGFNVQMGMKICDGCRIKLSKHRRQYEVEDVALPSTSSDKFTDPDTSLDFLNQSLELVGESPIKKKRLQADSYAKKKFEKVKTTFEKNFIPKTDADILETGVSASDKDESEIIKNLKEKFSQTTKRSEKMMILTVLPTSWSSRRIQNEFGVSNYMARAVKKLVKEKGIFSAPNPKPGKTLDEETVQLVVDFYNDDEVSRVMPGTKDFVSVRMDDGTKFHLQKRLVLANLKEIYQLFKAKHITHKIGFSKFCEIKPKNCILAGKSGTHTVCVCTIHQNVKLMLNGSGIHKFVLDGDETNLKDYETCLAKIMCSPPSTECYMNVCIKCPEANNFKEQLSQKFEDEMIDCVTYRKWIATDRCTMETVVKKTNDFIEDFIQDLLKLKTHAFITNQQKQFFNHAKVNLKEGEVVIICDFAENYSFILQDEVQTYHWNNSQATLHPFVVYYKGEDNTVQHLNYVFISECLRHNTVAFNLFQTRLIDVLKELLPSINKIFYFSDGSAAQYKNRKNFLNICMHRTDFSIDAEWHFFSTSHGKSACDGLGGTVKRLATKASLQRPYEDHIMTPRQLYDFAKVNITGINFMYCTNEEYHENEKRLSLRFDESQTVHGTQKVHAVIPLSESQMVTKPYSFSTQESIEAPVASESTTEFEEVESGFVTVAYDDSWWLACILAKNYESNQYKVSFLHPKGPSPSFYYPKPRLDILSVSVDTLLKKVDPCTATGRTYTLTQKEMLTSSSVLEKKLQRK